MNIDILISVGISIVLSAIKNPAKKEALRKAALKIYRTIQEVYGFTDADISA